MTKVSAIEPSNLNIRCSNCSYQEDVEISDEVLLICGTCPKCKSKIYF
jgi:Zn finger protein HypA/HybF involved in hydrogenase expression